MVLKEWALNEKCWLLWLQWYFVILAKWAWFETLRTSEEALLRLWGGGGGLSRETSETSKDLSTGLFLMSCYLKWHCYKTTDTIKLAKIYHLCWRAHWIMDHQVLHRFCGVHASLSIAIIKEKGSHTKSIHSHYQLVTYWRLVRAILHHFLMHRVPL